MKLRQTLLGCSAGLLRTIAAEHGLRVDASTLRSELVDELSARLTRAAATGELWRDFDVAERAAVAQVAAARGRQSADLFHRRLAARLGRGGAPGAAEAVVGRLAERGVLFRVFEGGASRPGTSYVLPDEYLEAVAAWAPAPAGGPPELPGEPLGPVLHNDPKVDCFTLASALRREGWNRALRPLVGGRLRTPEQVLARLQPVRQEVDANRRAERWRFFLRLGRQAGWIRPGPWPTPDDDRVISLLRDEAALPESLWQAYQAGRGRTAVEGQGVGGSPPAHAIAQDVLQLLAELRLGAWHPAAELWRWIGSELGWDGHPPPMEASDGAGGSPAVPDHRSSERGSDLRGLLSGPWFWLGLVRWAVAEEGERLVSTTPLLHEVLGRASTPVGAPESRPVSLGDDLELVAPLPADFGLLYAAERYLAFVGGASERRYRFTAASFSRGVRLGGSADDACGLLARLAGGDLPAPWERAIRGLDAQLGQLRLDARAVLSAAEPRVFARAMEVPAVSEAVGEQLSDRAAWFMPERLAWVLHDLGEAGHPVSLGDGLRLEAGHPARAALLDGAAEVLWVVLGALQRIDPRLVAGIEGAAGLQASLELIFPPPAREVLDRRAESLSTRLAEVRDRPPGRRRGSPGPMV